MYFLTTAILSYFVTDALTLQNSSEDFECPKGSYFTGQRCLSCWNINCHCSTPFGCDNVTCQTNQTKLQLPWFNEFIGEEKVIDQCIDCPLGCKECLTVHSSKDAFTCLSCTHNYVLINYLCIPKIQKYQQDSLSLNYWHEFSHLKLVSTNFSVCQKFNNATLQCIECPEKYFLNEFEICDNCAEFCKTCSFRQVCDVCQDGYFWNPSQCQKCHENLNQEQYNCKDCLLKASFKCLTCTENGYNCVTCNEGYYVLRKSEVEAICQPCLGNQGFPWLWHFGCKSCSVGGFCEECYDGYILMDDYKCKLCNGNTGVQNKLNFICQSCTELYKCDQCRKGFQLINNKSCIDCTSNYANCSQCAYDSVKQAIVCLKCQQGYYLKSSECYECPPNFKTCYLINEMDELPLPLSCQDTQGPDYSVNCKSIYYLIMNKTTNLPVCIQNDPENQCLIMEDDSRQCKSCYPFQKWIQNGKNCTICENCLHCSLESGTVSCSQCLLNYISINGQCVRCAEGCESCDEKLKCLKCSDGYDLTNESQCESCSVQNCRKCLKNVSVCTTCLPSYFLDNKNNLCLKCPFGCEDCQSSRGRTCSKCLPQYYQNNDGCRDQVPSCALLDKANGYCIVCKYGYRLLKGRCVPCIDRLGGYVCGGNAGMTIDDFCQQYF